MPRIAICAPATPITRDVAERVTALAAAEFSALELVFHEQCFVTEGHFAGPDSVRLAALIECANASDTQAVWFAKGGYGSNRIASAALAELSEAARSKTYLGYSDGGYLLAALYRERIGYPVHGPMPLDILREGGEAAVRRSLAWFCGRVEGLEPELDHRPHVAFNLMTLATLAGTSLMPDLTGHVVIVEEVAEHLYAIDRLFFGLTAQLHGIVGLKLGAVTAVPENDRPFGFDAEQIARHWCAANGIPYLGRARIGHDSDNHIVPFGVARVAPGE